MWHRKALRGGIEKREGEREEGRTKQTVGISVKESF
jgi:hypothetical protein